MFSSFFSRTALLIGDEGVEALARARVAVFGIGGVGSYAVEALARAGVGSLLLVDDDVIAPSNCNRQLHATSATLGAYKTLETARRVREINPAATVETREVFCLPENAAELLSGNFDYVIDAVDTVSAKLAIAQICAQRGFAAASAMGAGNKLDPTRFEVADLYETSVCPLCRVMRRELKKKGVASLKVVYSKEEPVSPRSVPEEHALHSKRQTPGSISFVPPVVGMILAGEAVRDLLGIAR